MERVVGLRTLLPCLMMDTEWSTCETLLYAKLFLPGFTVGKLRPGFAPSSLYRTQEKYGSIQTRLRDQDLP